MSLLNFVTRPYPTIKKEVYFDYTVFLTFPNNENEYNKKKSNTKNKIHRTEFFFS